MIRASNRPRKKAMELNCLAPTIRMDENGAGLFIEKTSANHKFSPYRNWLFHE